MTVMTATLAMPKVSIISPFRARFGHTKNVDKSLFIGLVGIVHSLPSPSLF